MSTQQSFSTSGSWKAAELVVFRFFLLYFVIQAFPLDWKFYRQADQINWPEPGYAGIFSLTKYMPHFIGERDTFSDWGIAFLIALTGAVIWSLAGKGRREYESLYYWLRVLLRYRLAAALTGFALIKIFPLQAPYPSLSNLNTNYGDLTSWKIFSMTLGIVPGYETFLGLVELLAAVLLLYRNTATIGAFLVIIFTGNVFLSNLAYEGGEQVYSLYLIVIALFLVVYDLKRLYTLFGLEQLTLPNRFKPDFSAGWLKNLRLGLKTVFVLFFIVFYGFQTGTAYQKGAYQYPASAGLAGARGIYSVTEFRLNNKLIPYSEKDSLRWKDVVFEKWATLSIRSNRPVILDSSNTELISEKDQDRLYEVSGSAGRHYFSYRTDSLLSILSLENRNKHYRGEKLRLHFERAGPGRIILSGINERNDSLYVVLDKIDKKYLLEEAARAGRTKGLKL